MEQETTIHLFGYCGIVLALATANWAHWIALAGAAPIVLYGTYHVLSRGQSQKERIDRLEEAVVATDGGETDDGN